jgi:ADP-heptose:LPS heptosyltransferase
MKGFLYISWLILELCLIATYMLRRKKEKTKTVTIVRLDAFGDFIIWIKDLNSILHYYERSGYKIRFIIPRNSKDLLREIFPQKSFDIFYVELDKFMSSVVYRIKLAYELSRNQPEIAIAPVFSRVPLNGTDTLLLSLAASKTFVQKGYVPKRLLIRIYKFAVSQLFDTISTFNNDRSAFGVWKHETIVNAAFTRQLIGSVKFSSDLERFRSKYKNRYLLNVPREYIVIMPGGSWPGKCWSKENYQKLVAYLNKCKHTVILAGDSADQELCEYIYKQSNSKHTINLCGKTDFRQLFSLIANSVLFVGNDSLGVHIAHLLNVKSLCISWGGSFGRFVPYPDNNTSLTVYNHMDCFGCTGNCPKELIQDKLQCVSTIYVDEVIQSVNALGFK